MRHRIAGDYRENSPSAGRIADRSAALAAASKKQPCFLGLILFFIAGISIGECLQHFKPRIVRMRFGQRIELRACNWTGVLPVNCISVSVWALHFDVGFVQRRIFESRLKRFGVFAPGVVIDLRQRLQCREIVRVFLQQRVGKADRLRRI